MIMSTGVWAWRRPMPMWWSLPLCRRVTLRALRILAGSGSVGVGVGVSRIGVERTADHRVAPGGTSRSPEMR